MAPDAWFGDLTPDAYQAMASGPVGVPKTDVIEQELYKAATEPQSYTVRDTIPSQLQLSLLQAARKAHNGAKQRKQQLLTHAQMRAANRVDFEKDLEKLASGGNLTGID
jgi:hypothetical protein